MYLNVFGLKVVIEYKKIADESGLMGYFDYSKNAITIDSRLKGSARLTTEIHESLHSLFHRLSYRQYIPHALEEIIIDQVSTFLVENFDIKLKKR